MATPELPDAPEAPAAEGPPTSPGGRYPAYVLSVLVLVYVFNFIDRQILSILAEEIKADLGLSDDQLGFLYGTAFAVFYAIFGIPLGRLADVWVRTRLISVGLAFWSVMTALSGFAQSFFTLGACRIGVGIGEASATPAAFSLLSDYFPPRLRATVLSIYSSGIYIGAGIGIFLGGLIVDVWEGRYPDAATAPLGLEGWQAAFLAVGLPGLLMAVWLATLREPVRGQSEGMAVAPEPHPFREFGKELRAVLPVLAWWNLASLGGGVAALRTNLLAAVAVALAAWGLIGWIGSPAQWIALGVGLYAAFCWAQGLRLRDPPTFALIFKTRALCFSMLGFSSLAFVAYGIGFWTAPFFFRIHGVSNTEAGTVLGLTAAIAGWAGVTLGGVWADRWRRTNPAARLWIGVLTGTAPVPFIAWLLFTPSTTTAYMLNAVAALAAGVWIGPAASTVNDLVLPRMRAIASATYILAVTFVGLALGPYTIGRVSVALDGDLRTAMLLALLANVVGVALLAIGARHLERDETTRIERARAAGEKEVPA